MTSLQERRKKYLQDRKQKMNKRSQPAATGSSIADILNKVEETDRTFLNVQVHCMVSKHPFIKKDQADDEFIHLVGEIEIADFLTFKEVAPKAIELLNSQLKDQDYEMEFLIEKSNLFTFKFAKKSGKPDTNFPSFDGTQKVSDCGVTNICLVYKPECIYYPSANPSKIASTVADTDANYSEVLR